MKTKVSEATGPTLDWLVAKCEGHNVTVTDDGCYCWFTPTSCSVFNPSTNWAQGGPLNEREGITVVFCSGDLGEPRSYWSAAGEQQSWQYGYGPYHESDEEKSLQVYKNQAVLGPTPLIAAMRCFVVSKLGDEVEVPDELS